MEVDRIFSAEQIKIHPDLPRTIKDYSKAVIRANPDDILAFSLDYFQKKADLLEKKYVESVIQDDD